MLGLTRFGVLGLPRRFLRGRLAAKRRKRRKRRKTRSALFCASCAFLRPSIFGRFRCRLISPRGLVDAVARAGWNLLPRRGEPCEQGFASRWIPCPEVCFGLVGGRSGFTPRGIRHDDPSRDKPAPKVFGKNLEAWRGVLFSLVWGDHGRENADYLFASLTMAQGRMFSPTLFCRLSPRSFLATSARAVSAATIWGNVAATLVLSPTSSARL